MNVFCGNVRKFAAKLFKQGRMNRNLTRLCALTVGALMLTSCLESDDDTTVYGDAAITNFTLGSLNRYVHTKSSKTGNDTIVKSTVTGSAYKMNIDHFGQHIYNQAPLPVGTDLRHVVCTITAKNGGLIAIQSMTSDSLKWYTATDSIDFSQPRTFRVYSTDGSAWHAYVVELNISSTKDSELDWTLVNTSADWAGWETHRRLVAQGDTVSLVTADSIVGTSAYERYMFSDDGRLLCQHDGVWEEEKLDDSFSLLPQKDKTACVSWPYATAANADYVLMAGTPRQDDVNVMRVWRKISFSDGSGHWTYMPFDAGNLYPLPRQEWLSMAYYKGAVLAVGSDLIMRQSRDQGITWKKNSNYTLPTDMQGTVVSMAVDNSGRLWLATNEGQLWRSR